MPANVDGSRLYRLSPKNFQMPNYVDHDGTLRTVPADNVPNILWPDGRWCHAANSFMRTKFENGLSRRNYGGSLAIVAQHIGHLIRYCWVIRKDFIDLSDNDFKSFIDSISPSSDPDASHDPNAKRQNSQVIAIGRSCLSLLASVAEHAHDDGFVGSNGRIRTIESPIRITGGKGPVRTIIQVSHASFPDPSPSTRRHPISQASIDAIREEASRTKDPFIRARRQVLITLLDATGARRGELAELTAQSVIEAARVSPPMLRMTTLKRGQSERLVPISPADLSFVRTYLQYHRNPLMRRLGLRDRDHGKLFVSARDGSPMTAGALGAEISELGRLAGCTDATCHPFRHRFITKLFVSLIRNHKIANSDQFRQLLLSAEAIKRKVMQWTGHKSLDSLEYYIDLAFSEIVSMPRIYDWAQLGMALDSFLSNASVWTQELVGAGTPEGKVELFVQSVTALSRDVKRASSSVAPDGSNSATD